MVDKILTSTLRARACLQTTQNARRHQRSKCIADNVTTVQNGSAQA